MPPYVPPGYTMVGILASLPCLPVYTPGYTLLPLYLVLSVHQLPLTLTCQLTVPWAQEGETPWVGASQRLKSSKV